MSRLFRTSKAKAALALTNPANATLPVDAETRISALEGDSHTHTSLTALNKINGYGNFIFSGDGIGVSIVTKTGNYTLTTADSVILCNATSGSFTITLPAASTCYDPTNLASIVYNISKIDSSANTVTIDGNGSETIGGELTFDLIAQNEVLTLVTNGSNWYLKD